MYFLKNFKAWLVDDQKDYTNLEMSYSDLCISMHLKILKVREIGK